jgi:hypothetical protein
MLLFWQSQRSRDCTTSNWEPQNRQSGFRPPIRYETTPPASDASASADEALGSTHSHVLYLEASQRCLQLSLREIMHFFLSAVHIIRE